MIDWLVGRCVIRSAHCLSRRETEEALWRTKRLLENQKIIRKVIIQILFRVSTQN